MGNVYVDLKWCSYLYPVCKNLFVKKINEMQFAALLNRWYEPDEQEEQEKTKEDDKGKREKRTIRSKEIYKFCFLLYRLTQELNLEIEQRDEWLESIFKATHVKKSYYNSHRNRAVRDFPKGNRFVDELNEAIELAKKDRPT